MNNKDLFNAIGNIDDNLISESMKSTRKIKRFIIFKKITAFAAAFVLIITGLAFGIPKLNKDGDIAIENDFGIIVKAESDDNQEFEVRLKDNEKIKLEEVNLKDLIEAIDDFDSFSNLLEIDQQSDKASYSVMPVYTFEKSKDGYIVTYDNKENHAEVEIPSDIKLDEIWSNMFEFVGKNIKKVTVKAAKGNVFYKQTNDKVFINFLPLTSIKTYKENEREYKDNYSELPKDILEFNVVFDDSSTLKKSVELSWDNDGSLIAEMK